MNKKIILFLPLIVFFGLGIFLYKGLFVNPQKLESALIGKPIPTFELLDVADGISTLTQEDFKGEVALVNVWGTWCPSCKVEHPFLMELATNNIITIYGINYRDRSISIAQDELKRTGNPYKKNVFDQSGRLGLDMGVYGAPETFIIDENGIVQHRHAGPITREIWINELLPIINRIKQG